MDAVVYWKEIPVLVRLLAGDEAAGDWGLMWNKLPGCSPA